MLSTNVPELPFRPICNDAAIRAGGIVRPNGKRGAAPRINVPAGNTVRGGAGRVGDQIDVNPGGGARQVDIDGAAINDCGLRHGCTSESDAGERGVGGEPRVDSACNGQLAWRRHKGGSVDGRFRKRTRRSQASSAIL